MAAINLEQGKTYSVKVTKIEGHVHRPFFTIKNTTYYNFVIHIELKEGKTGWVEYVSLSQDIDTVPFALNVWQWVKCRECTDKHCVIDPYDPEPQASNFDEKVEMARRLADPNYKAPQKLQIDTTRQFQPNVSNDRNLGFVGAWAKDALVAEMVNMPEGYLIEPADFAKKWGALTRLMYKEYVGIASENSFDAK